MRLVIAVHEDNCSCDRAVLQRAFCVFRPALIILGQKLDRISGDRALEFVTVKIAAKFFAILLQLHHEIEWRSVEVRADDPSPCNRGVWRMWLLCRFLSENHASKQQE